MPLPGIAFGGRLILSKVIKMADDIKPNVFSDDVKTGWINEAEGLVQTEVMLIAVEDVIVYSWEEDENTELLVRPPHDKLYWTYLTAMIDFANGEYNKYQNTMEMFNAYFSEYMRWFAERYRPADGEDVQGWPGYYISSYGIAVKHGFVGTEEEWLQTLKGEPGAPGTQGKDFRILGRYDTIAELDAAVQNPEPGDTYDVGVVYPYNAYMWDGVNNEWVDKGPLRGPQGTPGVPGERGVKGDKGDPGVSGVYVGSGEMPEGYNVKIDPNGIPLSADDLKGADGFSPTVSVSKVGKVTTIVITDKEGTKIATIKDGEDGSSGGGSGTGADGEDWIGIASIVQTTKSTEDDGINILTITLTDGSSHAFEVQNGSRGSNGLNGKDGKDGKNGQDGYTPVRGTDYWTETDIAAIKSYVDDAILNGEW